jgi:hypothetical protein
VLREAPRGKEFTFTYGWSYLAWGYKAAKDERRDEVEARGLLEHYPELVEIGKKVKRSGLEATESIDLMTAMVARWCEDHFGPLPGEVITTVNQVGAILGGQVGAILTALKDRANRLAHGKHPRKAGRKSTTRELADFAQARSDLTKKEIAKLWDQKHPNAEKVDAEDVREAYRRAYGDKSRTATKKRAE